MRRWMGWMCGVALIGASVGGLDAQTPEARALVAAQTGVGAAPGITAPRAWAPQDPADSLYRQARQALNRSDFRGAAGLFAELRSAHPGSEYVADAYYYEAFALYRLGSRSDLRSAQNLIQGQARDFPDAATREDAGELAVRIEAQLARTGDASAYQSLTSQATQSCEEGEQGLKSMALSALMAMDSERAVPILREVLEDRSECSAELRAEAVFILGQKMTDDVVPLILDLAVNDPDPSEDVREAAVFALSQVRSDEADAALEQILTSSTDSDVQEQALFAMSQRKSERNMRILRDYASNPSIDPDLRETAIFWIGQSGVDGTFDFLDQIYRSADDDDVREAAIFAINQSSDPRVANWLMSIVEDSSQDMDARENALFWYGQRSGEADVDRLLSLYRTIPEEELKESVLFGLSQRANRDEAALTALIDIARTEENPELVENALFWLGQSDDPRAAEVLLEIIRR